MCILGSVVIECAGACRGPLHPMLCKYFIACLYSCGHFLCGYIYLPVQVCESLSIPRLSMCVRPTWKHDTLTYLLKSLLVSEADRETFLSMYAHPTLANNTLT